MGRGRTVTLKGAAAGAYIQAMQGKKPATDEEKYLRLATFVHMHMSTNQKEKATLILKSLAENGLDATTTLLSR